MDIQFYEFVHPRHFEIFCDAAQRFNCHILVRKTGRAALGWVGQQGYTGKRVDLKAKTAKFDVHHYKLAGLVCSPLIHPNAFPAGRLSDVVKKWNESAHLITVPPKGTGFRDDQQLRGVFTPYVVQMDTGHPHYGCVALHESGLLIPRYVHGDYDLYAIVPAGKRFKPEAVKTRTYQVGTTMRAGHQTLAERLADTHKPRPGQILRPDYEASARRSNVANTIGPHSDRVADFVNTRIDQISVDMLGALMVNHGEQINFERTDEEVLAFFANPVHGRPARIIAGKEAHDRLFNEA